MGRVLVVFHSQGGNTRAAAEAVAQGAKDVAGTEVVLKEALKAGKEDLLSCDALAVGTPDYFSYMAGGLKDFFDRTYYPSQGSVTGKPCGIFVTHGGGGKAVESVQSICGSFKFKMVGEPVLVRNAPDAAAKAKLAALGKALAEAAQGAVFAPSGALSANPLQCNIWDWYRWILKFFFGTETTAQEMYNDLVSHYEIPREEADKGLWWETPYYTTPGPQSPIHVYGSDQAGDESALELKPELVPFDLDVWNGIGPCDGVSQQVPEKAESDRGAFLLVNWDDDDDDGSRDCDNDEIDGEDDEADMAKVRLQLDPEELPSTWEVELKVDDQNILRVFDDSDPPLPVIGPNKGKTWKKKLSDISLPEADLIFRLEGVEPGTVTLTATCHAGAGAHSVSVKLTVVKVELFRDRQCTRVLDDWPEEGEKLRSPKYYFGKRDKIMIKITGPSSVPYHGLKVQVRSESDSEGVRIGLEYVDEDTPPSYVNTMDHLGLGECSGEGPIDRIQVKDEEVLTFSLIAEFTSADFEEIGCLTSVMVDRGEILLIAGSGPAGDKVVDSGMTAIAEARRVFDAIDACTHPL